MHILREAVWCWNSGAEEKTRLREARVTELRREWKKVPERVVQLPCGWGQLRGEIGSLQSKMKLAKHKASPARRFHITVLKGEEFAYDGGQTQKIEQGSLSKEEPSSWN